MTGALGLLSVLFSAAVAYLSERCPAHIETLETAAGLLLIAGIALAASALPVMI